jgi:hypothetical protein
MTMYTCTVAGMLELTYINSKITTQQNINK